MNADKYQVLSRFQEKVEGNKVRCRICPHNCVIPDGKTGICRGLTATVRYCPSRTAIRAQ